MKKEKIIQVLKKESGRFYGARVAERIFDFKRIAIYQCAIDSKRNVLFFFNINEQEKEIVFYFNVAFTDRVRDRIAHFSYPIENMRRIMYGNFRYLPKMVEVKYEN